jgi:hypothetical protein
MSNQVETAKGNFSEELIGRLVPFLGVDAETVRTIVDSGIDALASVVPNSSEGDVHGAFAGKWQADGGLIALAGQGARVLNALEGNHKSEIVSQVAAATGTKSDIVEKALCIVSAALISTASDLAGSIAGMPSATIQTPKASQKKRITVGNQEEVHEAVVATPEAPAPAPLNFPVAEPTPAKSPSKVSEPAPMTHATAPQRRPLPTIAALVAAVLLAVTAYMKGCGSAPVETQPAVQPTQNPISSDAKLEDPAFPVNPEIDTPTK